MTIRIDQKIVGFEVIEPAKRATQAQPEAGIVQMHESVERPPVLDGSTYKIKTPLSPHALYVTVNDIILNPGTPHELRRPFEIFINSKNMDHFQWIVALTRIISAVFRKGGDVTFLVDELRSVFDPRGGYFKKGGKYMPSLVAEIGDVIESHLTAIGMLAPDSGRAALVAEQRRKLGVATGAEAGEAGEAGEGGLPLDASFCAVCQAKAVVSLDNCLTCLNCGDSKCG